MDLYQYLVDKFGYDEPIFMKDLNEQVDFLKPDALRQAMKRLSDNGKICKYSEGKDGIYFVPKPGSKFNKISVNKIIKKKYLFDQLRNQRIGYTTGLSFANSLKLTTQNPAKVEIVTAVEKAAVRIVNYKTRQVELRKSRVEINNENFKLLQVLDLLTNFDKLSTKPISIAAKSILNYLSDVKITKEQLNNYLKNYPQKTSKKLLESELYDALTQRQ